MIHLKDKLTEAEKAYLAGIFDGEGCVGYYKRKGSRTKYSYVSVVMVTQSDARLMTWLRDKIVFGTIYSRPGKKHVEFHWETNKKAHVCEFLETIRPYLILKGEQVDILLNHFQQEGLHPKHKGTVTPEVVADREKVYQELRSLKVINMVPIQ